MVRWGVKHRLKPSRCAADNLGVDPGLVANDHAGCQQGYGRREADQHKRQAEPDGEERIKRAESKACGLVVRFRAVVHRVVQIPREPVLVFDPVLPVVDEIGQDNGHQRREPVERDRVRQRVADGLEQDEPEVQAEPTCGQHNKQGTHVGQHLLEAGLCEPSLAPQPDELHEKNRNKDGFEDVGDELEVCFHVLNYRSDSDNRHHS